MYLKPYGVVNKGQSMQENITAAKRKTENKPYTNLWPTWYSRSKPTCKEKPTSRRELLRIVGDDDNLIH